jgi:hypothetical protein
MERQVADSRILPNIAASDHKPHLFSAAESYSLPYPPLHRAVGNVGMTG